MAISLSGVTAVIVYLLVAAAVFALLYYLVNFIGKQFPGEGSELFVKVAKIVLVVFAILILISLLLGFTGVGPSIRFTP